MTAFHDVALPLALALGATGGPERKTDITPLGSGQETRNAAWRHGRRRYDIGGGVRSRDDLYTLLTFFEARRGRLHAFRFRDFIDWKSCAPSQTITALDQDLGAGDGAETQFQLRKAYGDPAHAYMRDIAKPVAGSVSIALNGVALTPSAFSVDALTGVVTFTAPPASGVAVTAGFAFDTPVRFDADRLDVVMDAFVAGRALTIPLIETLD